MKVNEEYIEIKIQVPKNKIFPSISSVGDKADAIYDFIASIIPDFEDIWIHEGVVVEKHTIYIQYNGNGQGRVKEI
ncbi:hypothetical protein LCGC14_2103800 [marine sediment metagenome]|uniref:Uncharacterized protein n=1 Tax=marine sediment metagenome TaxID=412755 RepID=A0A0F9E932_9ZZZZ